MAGKDVVADGVRIRKMAKTLQDIGLEVFELEGIVSGLVIKPGNVTPAADQLRARFKSQVSGNGGTALNNLHLTLYGMGGRLIKVAGVYDTTEDLNTDDVERLRGLVGEVQKYFPDFNPFPTNTPPPTT